MSVVEYTVDFCESSKLHRVNFPMCSRSAGVHDHVFSELVMQPASRVYSTILIPVPCKYARLPKIGPLT
jgi:hypothetical protein